MRFIKEIARPAKYLATALDGVTRKSMVITADMLKAAANTASKMIEAGLKIPAPWKHGFSRVGGPVGPETTPGSDENAGYWDKFWYDDAKDTLFGELESPDEAKIGKMVKEVSPLFKTFTDGQGRTWENAPYHIALVTHPIMAPQANFEPINAAAGMPENAGFAFALSDVQELLLQTDGTICKDGIAMSTATEKPTGETQPSSGLKGLIEKLVKVGVKLPDDTTAENFIERLGVALEAVAHATNPEAEEEKKEPVEQPIPVAMSLGDNTVADTPNPFQVIAETQARKSYVDRVESLVKSGRITPAYATGKLKPMVEGFALSLNEADGVPVRSAIDEVLEALEAVPENTVLNVLGKAKTGKDKAGIAFSFEEQLPEGYDSDPNAAITEEQAEKMVNEQLERQGIKPKE